MIRKVLTNYNLMRISDLFTFTKAVAKAMTGNTNFPNPSPTPADLDKLADDYGAAIEDAKSRDMDAIAKRNALQRKVLEALSAYGIYINLLAKGDVEKLTSTRMELNKERTPTVLSKPVITVGQGTEAGSMLVKVIQGKGAEAFSFQYTDSLNGDGKWQSLSGRLKSKQIPGLAEGKQYWFRVIAIGSFDKQLLSDPVTAFVAQHVGEKAA